MSLSMNQNSELKRTPFYEEHRKLGARIVPFAGYEMPLQYSGIKEEHLAVRNTAGLFDVSHMGEILVSGTNSLEFVNYLVSNKISTTKRAVYTTMCNKNAGVVDDLLVYTIDDEEYLLVVNASNIEKDYLWIQNIAKEYGFTGKLENQSADYFQLAIQGPESLSFVEKAFGKAISEKFEEIKFFRYAFINIENTEYLVSRTGYTGEFGFEIYGKQDALKLFKAFINAGVKPCGLGSRDSLRLEAALPLYGNDLDDTISPLEAGLNFVVKLDKEDFVGKNILEKQKENLKRRLIGFKILSNDRIPMPRHGYKLKDNEGKEIGFVTSGGLSYILEEPIALGYIENKDFTNINIDIRNKLYPIKIVELPFVSKKK